MMRGLMRKGKPYNRRVGHRPERRLPTTLEKKMFWSFNRGLTFGNDMAGHQGILLSDKLHSINGMWHMFLHLLATLTEKRMPWYSTHMQNNISLWIKKKVPRLQIIWWRLSILIVQMLGAAEQQLTEKERRRGNVLNQNPNHLHYSVGRGRNRDKVLLHF